MLYLNYIVTKNKLITPPRKNSRQDFSITQEIAQKDFISVFLFTHGIAAHSL